MLRSSALPWLWISILVLALDRITKLMVIGNLNYQDVIPVLPFFNLTFLHNTGAAFSFLAKTDGAAWLLGGIALLVSVIIIFWLARMPKSERWQAIALSLIAGGALGNLWDRLQYGYVIDFIQVYYQQWYWPAFNIADSAIFCGAVMLIVGVFFASPKEKRAE